jgi:hypothetical protein
MTDLAKDPAVTAALGSPLPPPPQIQVLPAQARKPAANQMQLNRGAAPVANTRQMGGLATPSPEDAANRLLVADCQNAVTAVVAGIDAGHIKLKTLHERLTSAPGGEAIAAQLGYDVQKATQLVSSLVEIVDKLCPPAGG